MEDETHLFSLRRRAIPPRSQDTGLPRPVYVKSRLRDPLSLLPYQGSNCHRNHKCGNADT